MNTRIDRRFSELRAEGRKGFIAYITAGDPSLDATVDFVLRLEDAGVDVVELGIPFSDPLADGRVNQESACRALAAGATPRAVFDAVERIRKKSEVPLMGYTYANPVHARGADRFMADAAAAGFDGLLILDVPPEEAAPYVRAMTRHKLNHIVLVTPTTPDERIASIVRTASGFVYCISREGVTGAQKTLNPSALDLVRRTKAKTDLPVALGFGIGTPELARLAATAADAVVVGSAIVQRLFEAPHTRAGRRAVADWVARLVRAVKEVSA
ncbi:MAG: tryptophan synthase subunit alpha [Kiritimatiellae bacterium]|nr:tryptophan synthase subunit alpha [Kiritimatiellia bacterium]MDW8459115.1 tryptophan synthase subunit alpha [Verrucomicrobiota bacterium]